LAHRLRLVRQHGGRWKREKQRLRRGTGFGALGDGDSSRSRLLRQLARRKKKECKLRDGGRRLGGGGGALEGECGGRLCRGRNLGGGTSPGSSVLVLSAAGQSGAQRHGSTAWYGTSG
jgi:hypothetical protein